MKGWRATQHDLDAALAAMADMPFHPTTHDPHWARLAAELNLDLDAVTAKGWRASIEGKTPGLIVVVASDLSEAVRRVRQGVLGHPYHPSPPELRQLCNRIHVERRFPVPLIAIRRKEQ